MKKNELNNKTNEVITTTREALQLVYNTLNQGLQKKILKELAIVELFDRYGVEY